jgi:hypothetical protein
MKAQVLPAITPSVIKTKPKLMALVIKVSSVASGGRRLKSCAKYAGRYEEKQNGDQEGADGGGFEEIVDGQVADSDREFDNRDEVQNGGDEKREESGFEEAFSAAEQHRNDVQQPNPVERRGHTEPENGHFMHLG